MFWLNQISEKPLIDPIVRGLRPNRLIVELGVLWISIISYLLLFLLGAIKGGRISNRSLGSLFPGGRFKTNLTPKNKMPLNECYYSSSCCWILHDLLLPNTKNKLVRIYASLSCVVGGPLRQAGIKHRCVHERHWAANFINFPTLLSTNRAECKCGGRNAADWFLFWNAIMALHVVAIRGLPPLLKGTSY
jgi:hypothetical protein